MENNKIHTIKDKINEEKCKKNSNKFIITIAIFTAFLIIFTSFLRIPIIYNTQTTYNIIFHINLASILIFSIGIMFKPWVALFICLLGSVLGEWGYCLTYGCGEELPAYLLFMVLSPGLAGAFISIIRQKLKQKLINEIFAMVIGGIWQYFGLMIAGFIWYLGFLNWRVYVVFIFYPLYLTIFDLFFIPVSIILIKLLRNLFKVKYFDDLLKKNEKNFTLKID